MKAEEGECEKGGGGVIVATSSFDQIKKYVKEYAIEKYSKSSEVFFPFPGSGSLIGKRIFHILLLSGIQKNGKFICLEKFLKKSIQYKKFMPCNRLSFMQNFSKKKLLYSQLLCIITITSQRKK